MKKILKTSKKEIINIDAVTVIKRNVMCFAFSQVNFKNEKMYNRIFESLKNMKLK